MNLRLGALALGAFLATASSPLAAAPPTLPRATPAPGRIVAASADELYSAHARRLVRTYLRLRLLELHKADLERIRAVVEGKLGVDDLFAPPAPRVPVIR